MTKTEAIELARSEKRTRPYFHRLQPIPNGPRDSDQWTLSFWVTEFVGPFYADSKEELEAQLQELFAARL